MFTHQMNSVLKAHIPLTSSLAIIGSQTESESLKEVLSGVQSSIEHGSSLAEAVSEYPEVFPPIYVDTIRMGEEAGSLDEVMGQLADFLETSYALGAEVKSALYYPAAIITMAILSVSFILAFVMPQITPVFLASGIDLPASTRFLISLGNFVAGKWWIVLIGLAIFGVLMKWALSTDVGRYGWFVALRRMPGLGPFLQKVAVARVAQSMSTMLQSGVAALEALRLVRGATGDAVVQRGIGEVCEKVQKGQGIAKPLSEAGIFPTLFVQMVRVGEQSGDLEGMFSRIADAYALELRYAIKNFTSLLEPIIILIMAGVVGFIVVSLALPLLQLADIAAR